MIEEELLVPNAMPPKGWIRPSGNRDRPRIAIVGEAPGEEEERIGVPFVGPSGGLLNQYLGKAGIKRGDCYLTNVFLERPEYNNLEGWCVGKREADQQWSADGRPGKYPYPAMLKGKYLGVERLRALDRLRLELETVRPNMVIALGNVACWALLGTAGITKLRGTLARSTLVEGLKVLPTFHPAAVLRMWELYTLVMADLMKAARACHTPELIVPHRHIWVRPSLDDLHEFERRYFHQGLGPIGVDIETQGGQITCIGFAPTKSVCLVVPFWLTKLPLGAAYIPPYEPEEGVKIERAGPVVADRCYWTKEEEVEAMRWVRRIVTGPLPKVYQNGMYDMTYLWRVWRMPNGGEIHDTMIAHHAQQPELKKGLGFLASLHTDEVEWKSMRRAKSDSEKRDE